jgi:hypothetical protein
MTIDKLYNLIIPSLQEKIHHSDGLIQFASKRAKFEGWLKVEVIDTLVINGIDARPEIELIDVSFENVAIELKTINTNIAFPNVEKLTKPITKNTAGVVKDIESLRDKQHTHKFVLFVAFPITHENNKWQIQLDRIIKHLEKHKYCSFLFKNNVPGVIYLGKL